MIQLDELKYEVLKAEQAVAKFVEDNKEQLKESVRNQYELPSDASVSIYCLQAHVTAYFKKNDKGHNVYYSDGTWH